MPVNNFDFEKAEGIIDNIQNMAVGRAPISGQGIFDFVSVMQTGFGDGSTGRIRWEYGEYEPGTDVPTILIPLEASHDTAPFAYVIYDSSNVAQADFNNVCTMYLNTDQFFGEPMIMTDNTLRYGFYAFMGMYPSGSLTNGINRLARPYTAPNDSDVWDSRYWATETTIKGYCNSATSYWRAGTTYKWAAFWPAENP